MGRPLPGPLIFGRKNALKVYLPAPAANPMALSLTEISPLAVTVSDVGVYAFHLRRLIAQSFLRPWKRHVAFFPLNVPESGGQGIVRQNSRHWFPMRYHFSRRRGIESGAQSPSNSSAQYHRLECHRILLDSPSHALIVL